jgi:hypothetical protein
MMFIIKSTWPPPSDGRVSLRFYDGLWRADRERALRFPTAAIAYARITTDDLVDVVVEPFSAGAA